MDGPCAANSALLATAKTDRARAPESKANLIMVDVPKHIQIILEYDRLFRSHLLYEAIELEGRLDKIIAWHFCSDEAKHGLLFSLVFREGEIGFSAKIQVLRKLLKNAYPDLKDAFGYMASALHRLRALRNKFAHSQVVLPNDPQAVEEATGVTLKYFKDGREVEEFVSREAVDRQMEECKYLGVVAVILELLIEKRSCGTASPEEEERFKALATALRSKVQP